MRKIVSGAPMIMSMFRGPIHACLKLLALSAILLSSCGHRTARVHAPIAPARVGTTESGVASWYGIPYHGRHAASGEIYNMEQLTAAHRKLPFQTWVQVTNLSNGKHVDVRINDRGPFVKGRILDLSQAAARDIDMLRAGTARVRLKVIPPPRVQSEAPVTTTTVPIPPLPSPLFAVQAGVFSDRDRAESLRATLEDLFADARIVSNESATASWRVIVGREMTRERATELALRVRQQTGAAIVVREPEAGANIQTTPN
jgi:rare lipoprotein A